MLAILRPSPHLFVSPSSLFHSWGNEVFVFLVFHLKIEHIHWLWSFIQQHSFYLHIENKNLKCSMFHVPLKSPISSSEIISFDSKWLLILWTALWISRGFKHTPILKSSFFISCIFFGNSSILVNEKLITYYLM